MLYPLSYGRMCIQLSLVTLHQLAEARGFEPPVPGKGDNSLAVSPIRPLWHASSGIRCSRTAGSKHYTCPEGKRKTPGQRRVDGRSSPTSRQGPHGEAHNRLVTPRTRPDLESIPAYVPGRSFPGAVKLASNETTIGPLPSVREAIADAAAGLNRYPDNGATELIAALSERLGVPTERIAVGCGSVSLCQELVQITCDAGDEVIFAWRSFEAYPIIAAVAGATAVRVPNTADHGHD